jgi:hypothetical protein
VGAAQRLAGKLAWLRPEAGLVTREQTPEIAAASRAN